MVDKEKEKKDEMKKLAKLLVKLAEDPKLADEYTKKPGAVLKKAGISDETTDAIVTGDLPRMQKLFAVLSPGGRVGMFVMVVVPHPPPPPGPRKEIARKR